jgi:adenylate cyclase, class 2
MEHMTQPADLPSEIEAKFYPINKEEFRAKLLTIGAECIQAETRMRRVIYNKDANPSLHGTYLRIRDEGKSVRISVKVTADIQGKISDQKEIDIETSDFEKAKQLIDAIGCVPTKYQENLRESWKYKNSEIVIDTWPGLEPYVEIESPTEDELRDISIALSLSWEEKCIGSTDDLYAKVYNISKETALKMLGICTFESNPFENLSRSSENKM